MTQRDLNRAIARATGESVRQIANYGFVELTPDLNTEDDFGDNPAILDWDELDEQLAATEHQDPPRLVLG